MEEGALEGHLDEEAGEGFQNLPFLEVGVVLQKNWVEQVACLVLVNLACSQKVQNSFVVAVLAADQMVLLVEGVEVLHNLKLEAELAGSCQDFDEGEAVD